MLSTINNQVQTLPSADAIQAPGFVAMETMTDLRQRQTQTRFDMSHTYVPRLVEVSLSLSNLLTLVMLNKLRCHTHF